MSFLDLAERGSYQPKSQTNEQLGPGAYDADQKYGVGYKLSHKLAGVRKRAPSDKPLAFGSVAARNLNELD